MGLDVDDLFERRVTYPDVEARERLAGLVGLDAHKERLIKVLALLVNPLSLTTWICRYHPDAELSLNTVLNRPPLVILSGDVGTGKSALAETVGDAVARRERVSITLFPLSLSTRGQGRVGEMTHLLSTAFDYTFAEARELRDVSETRARGAIILLVDEADALAQSREMAQMHHEDRAGVNAFIRGIDRLSNGKVPAAVIMCTNRADALDPAIRRRAADTLIFIRPDDAQRRLVLHPFLHGLGFSRRQIDAMVKETGIRSQLGYGYTFSDLTQRLMPAIVLDAYPTGPVDPERAINIARSMLPTAPFGSDMI